MAFCPRFGSVHQLHHVYSKRGNKVGYNFELNDHIPRIESSSDPEQTHHTIPLFSIDT